MLFGLVTFLNAWLCVCLFELLIGCLVASLVAWLVAWLLSWSRKGMKGEERGGNRGEDWLRLLGSCLVQIDEFVFCFFVW